MAYQYDENQGFRPRARLRRLRPGKTAAKE